MKSPWLFPWLHSLLNRKTGEEGATDALPSRFTAFLSDADEIEESPIASGYPIMLYVLGGLFIVSLIWAGMAQVDQVVTSRGRLVSTDPNIVIQPIETAQIEKLNVTVGQVVKRGELLATLEPTFITADLTQTKERLASLDAQVSRLEAERLGKANASYKKSAVGDFHQVLQSGLEHERAQGYKARLLRFDETLARIDTSLINNASEIKGLERRVESLQEIEKMNSQLMEREFQSKRALLESRDRRLEVERELINARNRGQELKRELHALMAEKSAFIQDYRQKNLEDLVSAQRERDSLREQLAKAERRSSLVQITAPEDGVVLDVARLSKGSVIREAETLVTLVPLRGELEAEIKIDASEISSIVLHNAVRIKIDSYPFQKYGVVRGELIKLSQDSTNDPEAARQGKSYYTGRVAIKEYDPDMLKSADFKLKPGMSLAAEVVTTKRTVLSYLLYPILRAKDEAINER